MTQPFFSVVIPTRGRTHVVAWAIRSTLAQTFQDLECVVIDNNADDRVEKVCAQFSDSRLRRVKTGSLNMPDNLDEAYRNARGLYAVLIEDRQCLYHHTLSLAHELAQREELDCLLWNNDVFEDGTTPARLKRFGGDRTLKRVRSDDVMEGFCGRRPKQDPMESILAHRCAVKVSLLEQIRAQTGLKICEPCSPDGTAGLKIMNALESYHYFNGALSLSHSHQLSTGANSHRNKHSADEYWKSVGGRETSYSHVPIKVCFNENTCFNDYLRLAEILGGRLRAHPIDWFHYYASLGVALLKARSEGHDRTEELAGWRKALAAEPSDLRRRVEEHLRARQRRKVLQSLRIRLGIRAAERLLRGKKAPKSHTVELETPVPDFMDSESLALAAVDFPLNHAAAIKS